MLNKFLIDTTKVFIRLKFNVSCYKLTAQNHETNKNGKRDAKTIQRISTAIVQFMTPRVKSVHRGIIFDGMRN